MQDGALISNFRLLPSPVLVLDSVRYTGSTRWRQSRFVMASKTTTTPRETLPIAELLETLELLVSQARAYERALPPDSYPARAAVATLGELARQALNEARDIAALVEPPASAAHPFSPREYEVLAITRSPELSCGWSITVQHEDRSWPTTHATAWNSADTIVQSPASQM